MSDKVLDAESIFHRAREIRDQAQREAYLTRQCGGDAALRMRTVEKLLQADGQAESFPYTPSASSTAETLRHERRYDATTPAGGSSGGSGAVIAEQVGTVIGRYKLLQQIGEGGFGIVYMAEQREPVQRMVALKIIKLGMDTRDVIARFEQERQALAVMDHPNIARVLDAGATDTGRPYFVMELVKGVPITEYCDKLNMSFRERLDLFIQVCSAVQHAHQKGIIHRDIKPSNVLVTNVDGKPVPKVIDFGIAKATQQKLTAHTMFTQFGQFMGTPAYMSPEQADPLGLDVDTRSDIYSLGVLLYELLTGATPFELRTLRGAAIDEVRRIIREQDPPRPSTRLSTLGEDLSAVAKQRGVEPKKLGTVLRGDLDWIIMRAMEKDRTRRYDSATDLANDLQRYLNHEPVSAGPPSVSYRLHKFVRRNRAGVGIAAVAAIAIVGFAATMTVQAGRIAAERDRANHERQMSDRVVEFQADMLREIKPLTLGESIATDLRRRISDALTEKGEADGEREAALASFDSLIKNASLTDTARTILDANILTPATTAIEAQFADQPAVEARLQHVLGRTYMGLGMSDKALIHSQRALDLRRKLLGGEHRDTLRTLNLHAMILFDLDRNVECGEILRKAITSFELAFGPEDPDTLHAKVCLAALDVDRTQGVNSRKRYEDLIKVVERVLGPEHANLASTLSNYGVVLLNQHLYADAVPVLERSLKINLKNGGPDDPSALFVMQTLAKVYQGVGRKDEAAALQHDVMERTERVRGARHPATIDAVGNLADLYKGQGDYQKAEPIAKKALELHRAAYGNDHRKTVKTITDVGIILGMLGRHAEAGPYHVEAYERCKTNLGPDHMDTMDDLNNLAVHYWYLGQYQKSVDLFAENLAAVERRNGKDHIANTYAMGNLAVLYIKLGRLEESQAILERVLGIRVKAFGLDHEKTLETRASLAHLAYESGDYSSADRMYFELRAAQQKVRGADHPYTLEAGYNHAIVKGKLGQKEEAIELLGDVLAGRRRVVGATHSETLDTATELASLQFEAGRTVEARTLFTEVIAARRSAASSEGASAAQLHACAHILLTCTIEDLRNPPEALRYAEQAAMGTEYADATYLNTLAKALFQTGQTAKAAEIQRKAIAILPLDSPTRADYEERLAEYFAGDPS